MTPDAKDLGLPCHGIPGPCRFCEGRGACVAGPAERRAVHLARRRAWLSRLSAVVGTGLAMMLQDRLKLLGTVSGVLFAVLLGVQQLGVLFGLLSKNTMFVENAGADIWIAPPGTRLFQGGESLPESMLQRARGTVGVDRAEPLVIGGGQIRKPGGGAEPITVVGTRLPARLGGPWNVIAGSADAIASPDTMLFEDSQREKYGSLNLHSEREVNGHRIRVGGFTWGLQPFGPAYAFAEVELARRLVKMPSDRTSFVLVKLAAGADLQRVAGELRRQLPEASVMTTAQFSSSIERTLLREQLGISFGTSTSFGLLIGFVIVALSMFSTVIDNQRELGTLKALGWTNGDLTRMLIVQSVVYAAVGSLAGLGLVTFLSERIRTPELAVIIPGGLVALVPAVMLVVCVLASTLALQRLRKLDPGVVFK